MTDMTRRTVVRGTAWTIPVIAIAATAPAFAVSQRCKPVPQCKNPGDGQNNKTYYILAGCGANDSNIDHILVDGKPTEYIPENGQYETINFKDSRNFREVKIFFKGETTPETYTVAFPPC